MDRIHHPTAGVSAPTVDSHATAGFPTNTTVFTPWMGHQIIEELRGIVTASGITPDKSSVTQVAAALSRLHGGAVTSLTGDATLTADSSGLVLVSASGGNVTITLPAANAANAKPQRLSFVRADTSTNTITIQRAGSDLVEGATSTLLRVGCRTSLRSDGIASWLVESEAAIGRTYAVSGWQRLPGGLIIQWGANVVAGNSVSTISYPVAFATQAYAGSCTAGFTGTETAASGVLNLNGTGSSASFFQLGNATGGSITYTWLVVGL
jgi:hypothetical protein